MLAEGFIIAILFTACLWWQLWDSASGLDIVPVCIGHTDFVSADDDLVGNEDFMIDEVAGSVLEATTGDSVSDSDYDDAGCACSGRPHRRPMLWLTHY